MVSFLAATSVIASVRRNNMRFSLRSLLLATTAIAIGIAFMLYVTHDYRARMVIRNEILTDGAYWAEVDPGNSISVVFTKPIDSSKISKYRSIYQLELGGFAVNAASLENLLGLEHIDIMLFKSCTISHADELAPLSAFGEIRNLLFWDTPISDSSIDVIASVSGLKVVHFTNTSVTQSGIARLRTARPEISVYSRP